MRSAGVEGSAGFQFVVDTLGRVELSSVRELESTRPAFAMAVRGTLPRCGSCWRGWEGRR